MSITIGGSAFYFGDEVKSDMASISLFYEWIKEVGSDAQWPFIIREKEEEITRRLFSDYNEDYFYGVFLSAKNTVYNHYVKHEGDRIIVEARSTDGNPPVDMNFFCIRRDSNKGIYSHYKGSYPFSMFLKDLWASYRAFVNLKVDESFATETETEEEIKKNFSLRGRCNHSPLFSPKGFTMLVNSLNNISEVKATTYEVDGPDDSPVSSKVRSVHKVFRFGITEVDESTRNWLQTLRSKTVRLLKSGKTVHNGSILGFTHNREPIRIDFENTTDNYIEYDYDDLGNIDVGNIINHEIIKAIINQLNTGKLFKSAELEN